MESQETVCKTENLKPRRNTALAMYIAGVTGFMVAYSVVTAVTYL